jgi:hypothetical protein
MDKWPINFRRVAVIAGILLLAFLVMDFNNRLENLDKLTRQATLVSSQATQVMQTQNALVVQATQANSNQTIAGKAREDGQMIQPGDQLVVPLVVPGSELLETPEPTPVPTPLPNWDVWMELFFGQ